MKSSFLTPRSSRREEAHSISDRKSQSLLTSAATKDLTPSTSLKYEVLFFALMVVLLNLPLLIGGPSSAFVFQPDLVRNGEWWRILTHPFVHVSWYHLLLDASAFFLLYSGLQETLWCKRLGYVAAAAAGSLLASLWAAPTMIYAIGLCGLSGIAHGLLAVSALEMMRSSDTTIFRAGLISFLLVVGKCAIEAATGQVVFTFFHSGNIGTPVAVCHAGGVLGSLVASLGFAPVALRRPSLKNDLARVVKTFHGQSHQRIVPRAQTPFRAQ